MQHGHHPAGTYIDFDFLYHHLLRELTAGNLPAPQRAVRKASPAVRSYPIPTPAPPPAPRPVVTPTPAPMPASADPGPAPAPARPGHQLPVRAAAAPPSCRPPPARWWEL
jgi:hypothetical protein